MTDAYSVGQILGNRIAQTPQFGDYSQRVATTAFAARTWVDVRDYGAIGDGVNDDTAAIQKAINALPVSGGDVLFPPNNYKITSTINIGNGTSSAVSTRYGVRLIGTGMPVQPVGFAGYPTTSSTRILWAGAAAGTVLKVAGPLQGWGIQNLLIDGMSSANRGVDVVSAQYGDCRNLVIIGCETWGLFSETVAPFGGVTQTGAFHNRYDNTTIVVPSGAVGGGIILTSVGSTSNTLFNLFTNTTVAILGNTQTGIILQMAAGNMFVDTHITGQVGVTSLTFDYTVSNTQPANNTFVNIEPANTGSTWASNVGSPGSATPNIIYGVIETDGATPPNLSNLTIAGPRGLTLSNGGTAANALVTSAGGTFGIGTSPNTGSNLILSSRNTSDGIVDLFAGNTKGIRFTFQAGGSFIEGVDNTGVGSFQPLTLNGSTLTFQSNGGTQAAAIDTSQNATFANAVKSTGQGGVGYATGAGGAITQTTSRTTGVTLNNITGAITLVSAAGSTSPNTFTVTNSAVAATDCVVLSQKSGTDRYDLCCTNVTNGSFDITFRTFSGTTTEQPVFNFAVIKAVAN